MEALKRKKEVEIFEEHSKIGMPIQCAGLISLTGFKRLRIRVPENCIQNKVRGSIIYSPNNNKVVIKRKSTQALVIDRSILDDYLIRNAEKLDGKIHIKARVLELLKTKNNNIRGIKIKKDGKIIEKQSKIVIDGEGVQAR
ncbi:MAG: NAD(P)/FAD-dependent oxidoreductase, partial [Candidatus Hodarchaeota archaeon]